MRVVRLRSSARYVSLRVSKSMAKGTIQASDITSSSSTQKNGCNSFPIDDLEDKGNNEITDSEEETDDEGFSKGTIATQSTSQSQFLATEERARTPARKQLRRYDNKRQSNDKL